MKTFYLARHAQSQSNTGQTIAVNEDISLTALGLTQAYELAQWFLDTVPSIDDIFVSTYQRTVQTATPLLTALNKQPVVLPYLHEFNYLNFANIKDLALPSIYQLAERYWQTATPDHIDGHTLNVPTNWQAESFSNFVERVKATLTHFNTLEDGTYVVYTHGLWLSMLRFVLFNEQLNTAYSMKYFRQFELSVRPKNCEVFCLTTDNHLYQLQKVRFRNDND